MEELLVHEHAQSCQPAADTKSDHKGYQEVDQDVGLVGFARFAIIFGSTVLALDMREHVRPQRAAPPCKADFLGAALSAVGTGAYCVGFCMIPPFSDLPAILFESCIHAINREWERKDVHSPNPSFQQDFRESVPWRTRLQIDHPGRQTDAVCLRR